MVNGDIDLIDQELVEKLQEQYSPDSIDFFRTPLNMPINETYYAREIRGQAESSSLMIVNHSLLIAYSLLLKNKFQSNNPLRPLDTLDDNRKLITREAETLPEDPRVSVIIDEAHQLEKMAILLFSDQTALRDLIAVSSALIKAKVPDVNAIYERKTEPIKNKIDDIATQARSEKADFMPISKYTKETNPVVKKLSEELGIFVNFAKTTNALVNSCKEF